MIFLFSALRAEAQPFLHSFDLKPQDGKFPSFSGEYNGEPLLLTLTGTGPLAAASAVSAILSTHQAKEDDFLLSTGSAASLHGISNSTVVLIHRIHDLSSGRDYYPDLTVTSLSQEASIITGGKVLSREGADLTVSAVEVLQHADIKNEPLLYDMESAAVFHAGSLFLSPHQMRFLRVVTDEGETITKEMLEQHCAALVPVVKEEIRLFRTLSSHRSLPQFDITALAQDLRCSVTMTNRLRQTLLYCTLEGIDWNWTVSSYYETGRLPAGTREAGKRLLQEIEHELLG